MTLADRKRPQIEAGMPEAEALAAPQALSDEVDAANQAAASTAPLDRPAEESREYSSKIIGKYDDVIVKRAKPPKGKGQGALRLYGVHYIDGDRKEEPVAWEDMASEYGKSFRQPKSGEPRPRDLVRAPGYFSQEDAARRAPRMAIETTQEVAARLGVKPRVAKIMLGTSDPTTVQPIGPKPTTIPGAVVSRPNTRRNYWEDKPLRQKALADAREAWLVELVEASKLTFTPAVLRVGSRHDAMLDTWEDYELALKAVHELERAYLNFRGYTDEDSKDKLDQLHDQEAALITDRLEVLRLVRSGRYEPGVDFDVKTQRPAHGNGYAVKEVQFNRARTKWEGILNWYGDTSGTRKQRMGRAAAKFAVLGSVGIAIGAANRHVGQENTDTAGYFGTIAGYMFAATRVSRVFAITKMAKAAQNAHVRTRAAEERDKLRAAYRGEAVQTGILGRSKTYENYTMPELVMTFNNRHIHANAYRAAALAVTAVVSFGAGASLANWLATHNPFDGLKFWGNHGDVNQSGTKTPSEQPTKPPQQPGGGDTGNGNHHHNGNNHHPNHQHSQPEEFTLNQGHTIWDDANTIVEQRGGDLTPAEHRKMVGQILWQNGQTWESAHQLDANYRWHIGQQLLRHYIEEDEKLKLKEAA